VYECRRNIAENFNRLSRVHQRYRQTTDGRATLFAKTWRLDRRTRWRSVTGRQNFRNIGDPYKVGQNVSHAAVKDWLIKLRRGAVLSA